MGKIVRKIKNKYGFKNGFPIAAIAKLPNYQNRMETTSTENLREVLPPPCHVAIFRNLREV